MSLELISYQLLSMDKKLDEIRSDFRAKTDSLEHRLEEHAKRIRSLEDDRLRLHTVTLPLSIAGGALVSVLVKFAIDWISKGRL